MKINVAEKAGLLRELWRPETIAALNGHEVKLARLKGEFVWHHHREEDELFLGVTGRFRIEYRDHVDDVGPGDLVVVPRGMEHRTVADEEAVTLLFEPAGVRNTGNVVHPTLTAPSRKKPAKGPRPHRKHSRKRKEKSAGNPGKTERAGGRR